MKLSRHLSHFLRYLKKEKGRSAKTLQNYEFYLGRFIEWYGDKTPTGISPQVIEKYRRWLGSLVDVHGESLKKNTQNYHLIALRSLLAYLEKERVKTLSPKRIELMKTPRRRITFLESAEIDRLLEAPLLLRDNGSPISGLVKHRDKAILELLVSGGMRVSELAALKRSDIDLTGRVCMVKKRRISLSQQAIHWLKKYLDMRTDTAAALYISHDKAKQSRGKVSGGGAPLTPRTIQRVVQKYARAAGITKQVTPHTLRHTHANDLIQQGTDVKEVRSLLGHSAAASTRTYL